MRGGTINGNSHGILVGGTINSDNDDINIASSATLTATNCKIKNGNTCLLNPWKHLSKKRIIKKNNK